MEVEEFQTQACKLSRVGNGRNDSSKISQRRSEQYPVVKEADLVQRNATTANNNVGMLGGENKLRGWHHSSRIIRVSRASGGKDRHSKVWTSKGLRDRRVRLSVTTAIQFYDLQDRLGFDQPSKAVEWLIKAAADPISELPSLNSSFPETPKQLSDENRASEGIEQGFDSAELELGGDLNYQHNENQHLSFPKSACSSTSETSKSSGLSLSRPDVRMTRVKARERAKERTAKEKENESSIAHHQNVNPITENSSFTELLTTGISGVSNHNNHTSNSPTGSVHQNPDCEPNFFHKPATTRQWSAAPMNYFTTGLLGPSSSRTHHSSGFSGQSQLGNSLPPFHVSGENQQELQHFSFVPDHFIPVVTSQPGPGTDYNLNFTISSGLAGFNGGTLQSNSPSLLPHLQRFSSMEGPNVPFFIGTPPVESHHQHQFPAGFDGRLQLCYGDGSRHSDQKGKGKN